MDNKKYMTSEVEDKKVISALQSKLVLNAFIFIVFIGIIFLNISPGFSEYNNQKTQLLGIISEYNTLLEKGLSFGEFSSLVTDTETKKLIGKIGKDFYESNLENTSSGNYLAFIKEKTQYVNKIKSSDEIKLRDATLAQVLSSYQEGVSVDGAMTDLEYVNYIENLLKAFSLKTISPIGIKSLILVDSEQKDNKVSAASLASQIFYIPLSLELEGKKSDIIDFLYYIQNVGKVESVEKNNITFYTDNVVTKRMPNYKNIYESKLVDIDRITIPQYIDTSSFSRNISEKSSIGFVNFIKTGVESNDGFQMSVDLRFYVKGLPMYKLEEYIATVVKEYNSLKAEVDKNISLIQSKNIPLNTKKITAISHLKSIKIFLSDLDQTIKKLDIGVKQKTNLEKLYIDASKVTYDLGGIREILKVNSEILNKNNK